MKKSLFILLPILAGVLACNDNNNNDCLRGELSTTWIEGKALRVVHNDVNQEEEYAEYAEYSYSLMDGENIVFRYSKDVYSYFTKEECILSSGRAVIFEIPEDITEFEFIDEAIAKTNCFYNDFQAGRGIVVYNHQIPVTEGIIRGEKLSDDRWNIWIAVTVIVAGRPINKIYFSSTYTKTVNMKGI